MNYKKLTQQKLHTWMKENHFEGDYVIHHRDDTEECRKYNSKDAYYNMWGHNLDGSFEYGKYVVFMTRAEHASHHRPHKGKHHSEETKQKISANHANFKGEKHPMYGKSHSEETKQKIREAMKGKQHAEETKMKMSETHKVIMDACVLLYNVYKERGGLLKWNDFRRALKNNEITF